MENTYIYVVFSSTPYFIGKAIRKVTGEQYNHISISLDEGLTQMYGFARRYYRTPLYGGFVRESHARYCPKGVSTDICLCRLPVTREQYTQLKARLAGMYHKKDHYLYNHLSALGALFHKCVKVKDAYTCVEFCVELLHSLGIGLTPGKFYSVEDVRKLLKSMCIYTGKMPTPESEDPEFFAERPVPYPICTTLRELFKLLPRLGS